MDSQSGITETLKFESNLFDDEQEEMEIWDVTLLDGLEEE
jgi:hypothetical protein